MKCDHEYRIYNKDFKCLLEKVTINEHSICDSSIVILLSKEFLKSEKERQLHELEG